MLYNKNRIIIIKIKNPQEGNQRDLDKSLFSSFYQNIKEEPKRSGTFGAIKVYKKRPAKVKKEK